MKQEIPLSEIQRIFHDLEAQNRTARWYRRLRWILVAVALIVLGIAALSFIGCGAPDQAQAKITAQEHAQSPRQAGEAQIEITVQQPGWVMAGKAAFATGRGADTAAQAQAASNLATSQTTSKVAQAGSDAIKAGTIAIAAFGAGVPGLGIVTGGQVGADLIKLFHGEQDLIKTHLYFVGPMPQWVNVSFDQNENPTIQIQKKAAEKPVAPIPMPEVKP